MAIIRKNFLSAALIFSALLIVQVKAYACETGDIYCPEDMGQAIPVQDIPSRETVKEVKGAEAADKVAEEVTDENESGEDAIMIETDGYYQVDIENGDFYHFE